MSNIAEGFGYNSDKQFIRFLDYAKASAREVSSLLYVILDAEYIDAKDFERLYSINEESCALMAGLQRYLKS